jgi:NADPH:quinone reductase-like Zn-dependent oxidoreductase
MRAAVYREYGPPEVVLHCEDVEAPAPADAEVLIKVRAAAVNPLDSHLMKGKPYAMRLAFGLTKPRTTCPGRDVAGQVTAVGKSVTRLTPGDEVFGVCLGAFAEYACASEVKVVRKPASVSFEQAASSPIAGLTALQGLRDHGHLEPGHRVLINGASGGVGTFAVQIARSMGAEVTGVCSTSNVEMVKSLGADRVIDYTKEDFTRLADRYDLMLDCICNHSLAARRRVLKRTGRLVIIGAPPGRTFVGMLAGMLTPLIVSPFVSQKLVVFVASANPPDLAALAALMAKGTLTPVIDGREGLSAVPQAVHDVATRHARGKVVILLR